MTTVHLSLQSSITQQQPSLTIQQSSVIRLGLPINDKLNNLQKKSNKLIDRVMALQEQIQKYAEVEQREMTPMLEVQSKSLLQESKNFLRPILSKEMDPIELEYQQNMKRMSALGRNKVKMIERLEEQIQQVEQKLTTEVSPLKNNPSQSHLQQPVPHVALVQDQTALKQGFQSYYKHKNDMLRQSRSQKFSFRSLRTLMKQSVQQQNQQQQKLNHYGAKQEETNDGLQLQLARLREQFSAYQQRMSKQLEGYKERLNHSMLEKEMLRKELESQRYDSLKEKIFAKHKSSKHIEGGRLTSREGGRLTSREGGALFIKLGSSTLIQQQEPQDKQEMESSPRAFQPKTDRPTNDASLRQLDVVEQFAEQFQLEHFRDEVSVRFVEENQEIVEMNERLKSMQQQIQDLNLKLQNNHLLFQEEVGQLQQVIDHRQFQLQDAIEKLQETVDKLQQTKQEKEDRERQIRQMEEYITVIKEENDQQHDEIEEYKTVMEEFVDEVGRLRTLMGEKIAEGELLQRQLSEAEDINNRCEEEIRRLEVENQAFRGEIQTLDKQMKLKQARQRYLQAMANKQKSLQSNNNTDISSISTSSQTTTQKSKLTQQQQRNNSLTIELQMLRQLRQEHLQEISKQKHQFQHMVQANSAQVHQLEENLQIVKGTIADKVEQEVNEGIRTFLRYRKHTNCLQAQIVKGLVWMGKGWAGQEVEAARVDLEFRGINIKEGLKSKPIPQNLNVKAATGAGELSLRKIIDWRFSSKQSSFSTTDQLKFRLKFSLSLITFVIQFLHQQTSASELSSRGTKSNKRLPSLLPENIFLSLATEDHQHLSLQQKMDSLSQDLDKYHFVYVPSKQSQSKKDKSLIYLSPQVLLSMNESQNSYAWTLGVIIDEILNNRPYYRRIEEITSRKDNYKFHNKLAFDTEITSEVHEIMDKMLRKNYKERMGLGVAGEEFAKVVRKCV